MRVLRGEENGNHILKIFEVREIKKLLQLKIFSYKELAIAYGVSYGTINNIKSGNCWRFV